MSHLLHSQRVNKKPLGEIVGSLEDRVVKKFKEEERELQKELDIHQDERMRIIREKQNILVSHQKSITNHKKLKDQERQLINKGHRLSAQANSKSLTSKEIKILKCRLNQLRADYQRIIPLIRQAKKQVADNAKEVHSFDRDITAINKKIDAVKAKLSELNQNYNLAKLS